MKMYRRFETVGQMGAAVGVFALACLVLESGGLKDWANRLELGPERTIAVPLVAGLNRALLWTRIDTLRSTTLVELARIGWADDPEAIEAASAPTPTPETFVAPNTVAPNTVVSNTAAPNAAATAATTASMTPTTTTPATTTAPTLPPLVTSLPRMPKPGDAPLETELPTIAAIEPGKIRTVALAGDSMMAVGLSSTILRQAPKYKDLALVKTFKSGTGLARPEVFNWQAEYPAMLKDARPDIVLVAIGANDGQGFVEAGITYPFGTDGWKAIYRKRVEAYLAMLEAGGATVVWLSLPPMKSTVYDAHIAIVNRIAYEVVSSSPRAIWFSTAKVLGDGQGQFQDFGSVHGKPARLRQADGIHMTDDGGTLVAERLLPWLAAEKTAPDAPQPSRPAPQ